MTQAQKILIAWGAGVTMFLIWGSSVFAESLCIINGQEIPCGQIARGAVGIAGGLLILWILFWVVMLLCFVFWLWMLIHALSNKIEDKVVWVLVLLFTGILGAILYYFIVKRKFKGVKK